MTIAGPGGSAASGGLEFFSTQNPSGYHGWVGRIYGAVPAGSFASAPMIISVPSPTGAEVQTMALVDGRVGIGTTAPQRKLDVVGDVRASGSLLEKTTTLNPTTAGWYRIANGQEYMGGTVRISGRFDNKVTDVEISFNISGYTVGGAIQQTRMSTYNGGSISDIRISSNGGSSVFLDVYIPSVTTPQPLVVSGYGAHMPELVANPIPGAVAGVANVSILRLDHGFRTTHGGYFGGDVGVGTTSPTSKLHVAGDIKADGVIRTNGPAGDIPMFQ